MTAAAHIAVVVVNWNGLEDTRECLRSLLAQTHANLVVHVVDNGSANHEADQLAAEFDARIVLHRSPTNLGFTGGNNLAIRSILADGRATYVALLNNDATADPQWVEALERAARDDPATGVFASRMLFYDQPSVIENTGILLLTTGEAMPRHRGCSLQAGRRASRPIGACGGALLYRVSMLREIGLFRDDFFVNFEDVEVARLDPGLFERIEMADVNIRCGNPFLFQPCENLRIEVKNAKCSPVFR